MARRAVMEITPNLFLSLFRQGYEFYGFRVVENGLPSDARVVDVQFNQWVSGDGVIRLLLESAAFDEVPEGVGYPHLKPVAVTSVARPELVSAL